MDKNVRLQANIEETRAGDFGCVHVRIFCQQTSNLRCKLARIGEISLAFFGKHHRNVGGEIAVARIARRFDDEARLVETYRQSPGGNNCVEVPADTLVKFGEDVHGARR